MRLMTLLAAVAGLDLVTASPGPTDLARLQPRARVSWDIVDPYKHDLKRKEDWERICSEVLDGKGCGVGVIQSEERGGKNPYVRILGAPHDIKENSRKLRVHLDGSSRDGWRSKSKREHPRGDPVVHRPPEVLWSDVAAYKDQPERKRKWEETCSQVLGGKGCGVVMVHGVERTLTKPNGEKMPYVRVLGAPSMNMGRNKRMRVFEDGSTRTRWYAQPGEHRNSMNLDPEAPEVVWNPPNAYHHSWGKRKWDWEERCQKALSRKGCRVGTIHKGEVKVNKNGRKTSYVNVEGAPSAGMKPTEQIRVYQDGTYEDGWTDRGRHLMKKAKAQLSNKRPKAMTQEEREQQLSQYNVTWDPPGAYRKKTKMRQSFEDACRTALAREKCHFAVIHQGQRRPIHWAGSHYMNVSAWRKESPENKRLMRLFENGSSQWYEEGPVPYKEARMTNRDKRQDKTQALIRIPSAYRRPIGRPKKDKMTGTSAPAQVTDAGRINAPLQQSQSPSSSPTPPPSSLQSTHSQAPPPMLFGVPLIPGQPSVQHVQQAPPRWQDFLPGSEPVPPTRPARPVPE